MPPSVIIFRKRLLSYSETFIADQGQMLPTYQPVYCGFSRDNSGFALIQNSPSILLNQISKSAMIDKIRFRLGFGICDAWLQ
ncbi:MAG: glycosyltransferase, partial [Gammaproteobacteria bacterium]|nr:glycosyltransferase [Gammaproteobacteria bacterium]